MAVVADLANKYRNLREPVGHSRRREHADLADTFAVVYSAETGNSTSIGASRFSETTRNLIKRFNCPGQRTSWSTKLSAYL